MLADQRVVALREFADELVRARELGRFDDRLDGQRRIDERDVVPDRAVEQRVFLQHDADLLAQRRRVDDGDVLAIHEHASAIGHVQALCEPGERALSRSGTADDADDFARGDAKRHAAKHFRRFGVVAECDLVELDLT